MKHWKTLTLFLLLAIIVIAGNVTADHVVGGLITSETIFSPTGDIRPTDSAKLDSSTMVLAYVNNATFNGYFAVYDKNGTIITSQTYFDGNVRDLSVATLDSSTFVITYSRDSGDYNGFFVVYDKNGMIVTTKTRFSDNNSSWNTLGPYHVSVSTLDSSTFVIGYGDWNDSTDHGSFKVYNKNGAMITGETIFDYGDIDYISIAALDSSTFALGVINNDTGITSFWVYNKNGNIVTTQTILNGGGAITNFISLSTLDSSTIAIGYADGSLGNYLAFVIYDKNGTIITPETFITQSDNLGITFFELVTLDSNTFGLGYCDESFDEAGYFTVVKRDGTILDKPSIPFKYGWPDYLSVVAFDSSTIGFAYRDREVGPTELYGQFAVLQIANVIDCGPYGDWSSIVGLNGDVKRFATYNGKLYVGGYTFTDGNGISGANNIIEFDGTNWHSIGGLNDYVSAFAVYNNELYIGGDFEDANSIVNTNMLTVWNGSSWRSIGGFNSTVFSLATYHNELYVGGNFLDGNSIKDANNIIVWNGTKWRSIGAFDEYVYSMTVYNDELYVGGAFIDGNGISDCDGVCVFSGDTNTWHSVGGLNDEVSSLAVYNGELYVSGYFDDGNSISDCDYLCVFNGDTNTWRSIGPLNGEIESFATYNGELFIGGSVEDINGILSADYVAVWNGDTNTWRSIGALDNPVRSLEVYNNKLYVGGEFHDARGIADADHIVTYLESYCPRLSVQFWDENSQTKLNPTTLTLNGTNITSYLNGTGKIELSTGYLSNGYYTINASDATHSEREWTFLLNTSVGYDTNFALLPTSMGGAVPFEFYKPDALTRVASTLVAVWNTDGNYISSIISTNALGQVSYFLNAQDENYRFDFNYAGTLYAYGETLVTVKIPKDEQTLNDINPWNLRIEGVSNWTFSGLTTDQNIYVFSDVYGYHYFDVNAPGFFERYYAVRFKGGVETYTLQPYLVSLYTGMLSTVRVVSPVNQVAVSGVEIKLYRTLSSGIKANVETVVTDSKGEALIAGIINYTYEAEVYYDGEKIGTFDITITSSLWVITYNPATIPTLPSGAIVSVNFSPGSGQLDANTVSLTQSIYISNATISSVVIFLNDGNVDANLHVDTFVGPTTSFSNTAVIATDLSGWDANKTLTVTIQILFSDGNVMVRKTSYAKYDAGQLASQYLALWKTGIRPMIGCPANGVCGMLIFLACVFTMLVCGALIASTPLRDPAGISGMGALILGFFVYLEWIPLFWYVLICVMIVGFMISKWRVES